MPLVSVAVPSRISEQIAAQHINSKLALALRTANINFQTTDDGSIVIDYKKDTLFYPGVFLNDNELRDEFNHDTAFSDLNEVFSRINDPSRKMVIKRVSFKDNKVVVEFYKCKLTLQLRDSSGHSRYLYGGVLLVNQFISDVIHAFNDHFQFKQMECVQYQQRALLMTQYRNNLPPDLRSKAQLGFTAAPALFAKTTRGFDPTNYLLLEGQMIPSVHADESFRIKVR